MQKALLRQLKRCFGLDDPAGLDDWLAALRQAEGDQALKALGAGLAEFLERVDATYAQYERDLELKTRSLEISSSELSEVNDKLRSSLAGRENALLSLREVMADLLPNQAAEAEAPADEDIVALSGHIRRLVAENEAGRRELANQKFALDEHAIVSITDQDGFIQYANDRFCQISGYTREELIGRNHRIAKSNVHPPEFFAQMWETIRHGEVWKGEICNRKSDGGHYWVSATIVPLLGGDGKPERYIAIRTDISDRKRMEAELSRQLHLVEELIETIPLPVYLKDAKGRYIRLNRSFESFFQIRREDYIGRTLEDLLNPEDARVQQLQTEKDAELFAKGGTQFYETVVHSKDGQLHHALCRKALLTGVNAGEATLLGVIVDITERKQAEIEIVRAMEAAKAASEAKSNFLANMSHEIRTPMNGVIGMTDLTLDTDLTDEQREYLNIVKSSAEALLTIINDILDFSKIEAGKLSVEEIPFDLHRVVADTLKPLALRAYEKKLELLSDIDHALPRFVHGDPGRIRQILINLIGNAIKFTAQGEVMLSAKLLKQDERRAKIQLSVRDTGIGIAPDKQHMVFEAFAQEDSSTTRKYGGTGLGLSISKRLVDLMGGEMWLDSTPGQGSEFHFSISLRLGEKPLTDTTHINLSGRHMLVVDDNATNRRIMQGMLSIFGIVCQEADSGTAAIALLEESGSRAFDAIVLDAQMPEMDGYELAARLRATHPGLPPMLMLSSSAQKGDAARCKEMGIAAFFTKPISGDDLRTALANLFATAQAKPTSNTEPPPLITRHALREAEPVLKVLLVEDHPTNQKLALSLLNKWGHDSTLVQNGQEAVDILAHERFDVVLMDMQMPVMGGIEATRHIRAREAAEGRDHVLIIAMTAAAMQDDKDACMAAGMDDYLSKPIKVKELQEKLQGIAKAR